MNQTEQIKIAQKMGWQIVGEVAVEIETPISDKERIDLGKYQADELMSVRELEDEKKSFDKKKNSEITNHMAEAIAVAQIIRDDCRREERILPCFLDYKTGERIYMDPETKEVLKREPLRDEDKQMRLGAA